MINVAVLGSTGVIGSDLVSRLRNTPQLNVCAVPRRVNKVENIYERSKFLDQSYDLILNCAGIGDPETIRREPIPTVKSHFDSWNFINSYLDYNTRRSPPVCVFISSGAIFNEGIESHGSQLEEVSFNLAKLNGFDSYRMIKLLIESLNRSRSDAPIIDLRVFGYVTPNFRLDSNFFLSQLFRATKNREIFHTSPKNFVRDYVDGDDIYEFLIRILNNEFSAGALNLISNAPTTKFEILEVFRHNYGLKYRIDVAGDLAVNDLSVHANELTLPMYGLDENVYLCSKRSIENILNCYSRFYQKVKINKDDASE